VGQGAQEDALSRGRDDVEGARLVADAQLEAGEADGAPAARQRRSAGVSDAPAQEVREVTIDDIDRHALGRAVERARRARHDREGVARRGRGGAGRLNGHPQLAQHVGIERHRGDHIGELRLLLADVAGEWRELHLGMVGVACGERGEERRGETGGAQSGACCHGASSGRGAEPAL
jgi:hypothetical protein